MRPRTELERLADARPALLDHASQLLGPGREEQILARILSTPRRQATQRPASRTARVPARWTPRPVTGLIALASAAVLAAVATGLGLGTSARSGRPAGSPTLAGLSIETLASRTIAATARANGDGNVLRSRTLFASGAAESTTEIDTWEFGVTVREKAFDAGALTFDASAIVASGSRIRRFIDYTSRTWAADSIPVGDYRPGPGVTAWIEEFFGTGRPPGSPSRFLTGDRPVISSTFLDDRRLLLATSQWPANTEAIRPWPLPALVQSMYTPNATVHSRLIETVAIDAVTYLPVAISVTTANGGLLAQQTFDWLPATAANLTSLVAAPAPAGFACARYDVRARNPFCPAA